MYSELSVVQFGADKCVGWKSPSSPNVDNIISHHKHTTFDVHFRPHDRNIIYHELRRNSETIYSYDCDGGGVDDQFSSISSNVSISFKRRHLWMYPGHVRSHLTYALIIHSQRDRVGWAKCLGWTVVSALSDVSCVRIYYHSENVVTATPVCHINMGIKCTPSCERYFWIE